MPAKRFGAVNLSANVPSVVASGANGVDATVNVVVSNHGGSTASVYIAYAADSCCAPDVSEYLRPVRQMSSGDFMEVRGIALQENFHIIVGSDSNQVSAIAYGFEEVI